MKYAIPVLAALVLTSSMAVAQAVQRDSGTVRVPAESGVSAPVATKEVKPVYPRDLLKKRVEGQVVVTCLVGTDGRPSDVRVATPSNPALDKAAVKALQAWRFTPGTKDGRPVPVRVDVEFTFTAR